MTLDPGEGLSASTLTTPDGRTLRYVEAGQGGPVVVFEAGLGAAASMWAPVQRLVAAEARAVAYDRAGLGGSTPDTQPRSLARIGQDLRLVVGQLSPKAPVVLVGHSWGGPIIRSFADAHPERVAGIVLVDATHTVLTPANVARWMPMMMQITRGLYRVGLGGPILRRTLFADVDPTVSAEDLAIIERDLTARRGAVTSIAEATAITASLPLIQRLEHDGLPDVPFISLIASGTGRAAARRIPFVAAARAEADAHPRGECRVIDGIGHYVTTDKPADTAQAILDVVQKVRER